MNSKAITHDDHTRTGKWTTEEELYADKLIELFFSGRKDIGATEHQSLRAFLAKKLQCSRMRVSKKYCSIDGLGRKFKSCSDTDITEKIDVQGLEKTFFQRDMEVQSKRLKRRKYYDHPESSKDKKVKKDPDEETSQLNQTSSLDSNNEMTTTNSSYCSDSFENMNSQVTTQQSSYNTSQSISTHDSIKSFKNTPFMMSSENNWTQFDPLFELDTGFKADDYQLNEDLTSLYNLFNDEEDIK
mmetsp:Transcript_1932/g.2020  ORF Transcript_1932/g.2020 Transcript_1932/m.2020 type:complete len:242 (+) Transcript_1932:63-788(+)